MAFQLDSAVISLPASGDLSANQYRFHTITGGQATLVGTLGANADGVLQNKPSAANQAANLAIFGVVKVVASAAIAVNAQVASTNDGRAVTATTGNRVLGRALQASSAAGQIISVLLKLQGEPNA